MQMCCLSVPSACIYGTVSGILLRIMCLHNAHALRCEYHRMCSVCGRPGA